MPNRLHIRAFVDHPAAFATMTASLFFSQLAFFLTPSALPLYLRSVGAPTGRIGLDVGAGSITAVMVSLAAAPLLTRHGPRPFLVAGSSLYLTAALVMLVAPAEVAITAGRLLQGAALAVIGPSAVAAIPNLTKRVGSAIGVMSTVSTVPLALGPPVGLALYQHGGPPWFLIPTMGIAGVGLALGLSLRMPGGSEGASDLQVENEGGTLGDASGLLPAGVAISTDVDERRRRLFHYDSAWTAPLIAAGLNSVYFGAVLAYLPIHLTSIHGPNAGIFFTADAIGVLLLRVPSGILADRSHPTVPMLLGFVLTLAGLAAFVPATTVPWLVAAGAGTGLGAGLFASGVITLLLGQAGPSARGGAIAFAYAAQMLGGFLGSSVAGVLYAPVGFQGIILFGAVAEAVGIPLIFAAARSGRRESGVA